MNRRAVLDGELPVIADAGRRRQAAEELRPPGYRVVNGEIKDGGPAGRRGVAAVVGSTGLGLRSAALLMPLIG